VCGIAGFLIHHPQHRDLLISVLSAMAFSLRHRGPDGEGVFVDVSAGVGLANRRLAVTDRSRSGDQPMASPCGRFTLTYNGEIYNYEQLRRELERSGHRFRGRSDTEVLLAAVVQWGLHEALRRSEGMFAFALWDSRDRSLHLARDRLGKKPLYYGPTRDGIVFGSELRALRAYPGFDPEIDRDALAYYLRLSCVPSPRSIYASVYKLPPGHTLTLRPGPHGLPEPEPYWTARAEVERCVSDPFQGSFDDAADELDLLLREAVERRMHAEVPVGAFLSGGIDSSTVVAMMSRVGTMAPRTFTIGFAEAHVNEADHARRVAKHLGTDHTEILVTASDALEVVARLPEIFDEPFADSAQIPAVLLSEQASSEVTVSLAGDGGDELFGGYSHLQTSARIAGRLRRVPIGVRAGGAAALRCASTARLPTARSARRLHRVAELLPVQTPEEANVLLRSHWSDPEPLVVGASPPTLSKIADIGQSCLGSTTERIMCAEASTYLPDDVLVLSDRTSMRAGLEVRAPLLDTRVFEFAWRLPVAMKLDGGTGKRVLRSVLHRYVPPELVERPKVGFGVPLAGWLRGELRDWAEALLAERRLRDEGYLNPRPIRDRWREHLDGRRNWSSHLWDVLMFQAWIEQRP
jgi:asparagine synthase (glutamine-hydrolysing)